jgi:CheY-like chemotaxis protein
MSRLGIFYAEDNVGDVKLVREALVEEELDFDLRVAKDGEEGLALLSQFGQRIPAPNVILLDLNLPKVNGLVLLAAARHNKISSEIPVIIFTSSDSRDDREQAAKFGATQYFLKPADLDGFSDLAVTIRNLAGLG